MMSFAQLPDSFWGYTLETIVYILNNVPSKSISEFGDAQHGLEQKLKKLEYRSKLCLFVVFPKKSRGGLFYDSQENIVFVSKNATFLEEEHNKDPQPCSKLLLNAISESAID